MKRVILASALMTLALPGSALASASRGVVLSLDRHHHIIQVVDGRHVAHAYHYRGVLPSLHVGSTIAFQRSGQTIGNIKLGSGSSRTVTFFARVVRSSRKGIVLKLADGRTVQFSASQVKHKRLKPSQRHKRNRRLAHAARDAGISVGGVTVNIAGLQPGVTVLVSETVDDQGNVTITITLPSGSSGSEQQASGVVTEVDSDTFMVETGDGSYLRLHMAQDALNSSSLQPCDTVAVSYHQDAGLLIADNVQSTGTSVSGDCAGDQSDQDVVGTITQVSDSGVSIDVPGQGAMSFTVDDPSITDGFGLGDVVDVTYSNTGYGTLDASDVEYVEQDLTGTVSAVSDGSMTITDDQGNSQTFTANPSEGMFDGVALGDQVDVTYHTSAGQDVADVVDDLSNDWGDWGS